MILLRRDGQHDWREPASAAYQDEAALQTLLAQSPGLLYGVTGTDAVVARELPIPGTGYLDLAIVQIDGSITLVECKLRSNPEIRRSVVGQILAYAAGMAGWSWENLDAAWRASHHGSSLADDAGEVARAAGTPFDPDTFREAVNGNLAAGRFTMILAVDHATEELRRIVEFLNRHTVAESVILTVEFDYVRDDNIEILTPTTYGADTTVSGGRRQHNDETRFRTVLTESYPARISVAVDRMIQHALGHPAFESLSWGSGTAPSATPRFHTPSGVVIQPWTFYTSNSGSGDDGLAFNFEYAYKGGAGVTADALRRFLERVVVLPGVKERTLGIEQSGWRKRPTIPAGPLFSDDSAVNTITEALDLLLAADGPTSD